ncbi:hypothetical protein [Pseudomonas sp. Hg5Tf]|uniref:Uncharacterized protein n=1 Tax=Pseudomonas sp. Hg7Tf TaxID=3236988 RepID=A0AB39HXW6_9PSED|nr:hypothetical protein [Pseudomonas sp. Hg5Tf]MDH2562271.1 hypothetical protein [Pseudomonas sp. Hg5Tf]
MSTIYNAPKDLAESLQALDAMTLPATAQQILSEVLRSLDQAEHAADVDTYLAEAGGLILGFQQGDAVGREEGKQLNRIFEAMASNTRRSLA